MKKNSKSKELTVLPMAMAFCRARRVLRPFLRHRPTFLAIFVVTLDHMAGYFESACEVLLNGKKTYGVYRFEDNVSIRIINPGKSARDTIIGTAQGGDRNVVLIFTDEAAVPDEYRVAADVFEVISEFDDRSVVGAIYCVCKMTISEADVRYLRQFPIERLAAVFRRGRTVNRALSILRRDHASRKRDGPALAIDEDEPVGIEGLIGFGEAQVWGLQILRDLKLFGQGKLAWRDVDPGLLLSGPTGTGKTRFAISLARSSGYPLIQSSVAQWQAAGHLGEMLGAMRASFKAAADNAPSILLIDEIDSLGDRAQLRGNYADYTRQVINAALECLDGALQRPGVIAIATTNYPELVDSALLRPGRMDKHIKIKLPDAAARLGILHQYLGITLEREAAYHVLELTEGWSGAQLNQLARHARRRARERDRGVLPEDVIASMPESIIVSAERLHTTAVHECGHAIVATALGVEVQGIRIIDRYDKEADEVSVGAVLYRRDGHVRRTLQYYLDEICILMSGVAAEVEIIGDHDDGVGGTARADLTIATKLATLIEFSFGMGKSLISDEVNEQELSIYRLRDPIVRKTIDETLSSQLRRSREIIGLNRDTLEALAALVVKKKRMTEDELTSFFKDAGKQINRPPQKPQAHAGGLAL